MKWVLVALLALTSPAFGEAAKPWAAGVSDANQTKALELYNTGNVFFEQAEYKEALEAYVAALALWDHPAIRYNAAVCRINLDRPLEAYEDLDHALRFGAAPLGPDLYKQGQSYQKLLAKQVAELDVAATDAGAQVTFDGRPMFTAPGRDHRRVLAGDHQIVVTKNGFITRTENLRIAGGETKQLDIALVALAGPSELHRRWPKWVPYTVMVAGGAIALGGIPLILAVRPNLDKYDALVAATCEHGCPPGTVDSSLRDRTHTEKVAAVSMFVGGGAILAAGVAMVILNQPKLAPVVGSDHVGLAYQTRW